MILQGNCKGASNRGEGRKVRLVKPTSAVGEGIVSGRQLEYSLLAGRRSHRLNRQKKENPGEGRGFALSIKKFC